MNVGGAGWRRDAVRRAGAALDALATEGLLEPIETETGEAVLDEHSEHFGPLGQRVEAGETDGARIAGSLFWFTLCADGQVVHFDNERQGVWDEGYRELLPRLVRLSRGVLDDVSLTVRPSLSIHGGVGQGPLIVATTDSWRDEARVADFGGWCDTSRGSSTF